MILLKSEKAITLTALLVAIILVVIIAALSINIALGDNGIFIKSTQSVSTYIAESIKERVTLKLANWDLELLTQNKSKTIENILRLANEDSEITEASQNGESIILVIDGYQCVINSNLEIIGSITEYNSATTLRKHTTNIQN